MATDKLRILFIHHHRKHKFDFRAVHFAEHLAKKGYEITAICTSEKSRFTGLKYEKNGVSYFESPDLFWGNLRSGWCPWSMLSRMLFLKDKDFDLIYAFETRPSTIYPVLRYLKRKHIPLVIDWVDWWGRGGLITENRPKWYQFLFGGAETFYEEHYRKLADATIIISNGLFDRAVSLGVDAETISEIPNGAETDAIAVSEPLKFREKFKIPQNAFVVCDSGKDVLIGVDLILSSIKEAIKLDNNVMYIMTGNKQAEITKKADSLELGDCFRHFGFLPKKEMTEVLSCADVFILPFEDKPSNRGRWPGKIGKYLSLGKPIISNPVGVMKKVIQDEKTGLLAEENPKEIAKKILLLKQDTGLYEKLCINARKYAETKLQWASLGDQVQKCMEAAICSHHNGQKPHGKKSV